MHKEQQSFIRKYIFSTDHKVIGFQYTIVGLFMALVGGYLAYVFRYNLAFPGESIPFFGDALDPKTYNGFVTYHGAIMFFWVAMPILLAGFGNLLIPLMVGTDDMAFPTVNMLSFWIFFLSTVVLLISLFLPSGPFDGGWTIYPPLSADGYHVKPSFPASIATGGTLFLLALALEFTSMIMGGINFIVTTIAKRTQGMTLFRLPIFVWFQNIAALIFMVSVGPVVAGAVMLLLDRTVGTGFFDPARGGDPILWQHLFWFFGHPEVYVILLPALGIIGEIIPTFSRKPLFGYRMMIYLVLVAAFLSVIVWAHHQFVAGIDPRMGTFFSVGTILISVPFAGVILSLIATMFQGKIRFTTAMCFATGMVAAFLVGGLTGIFLGSDVFDIYAHDTYFVVAHFHYTVFPIAILASLAGIYYWFPKFTGKQLNETLGKIHFWLTFIFFNLFAFPLFFLGLAGQHRRIANYEVFDYLAQEPFTTLRVIATIGVIGIWIAQFVFLWNLIKTLRSKEVAERNPWNATTLEWAADSPPPHGNWQTPPVVYRWAYEYSPENQTKDFIPQYVQE